MVFQPPQGSVCSGFHGLEASFGVAQLEAEIARPTEALGQWRRIRLAAGCAVQRLGITAGRAWRLAAVSAVKLRIVANRL